jgi:hypothetical protein
VEQQYEKAVRTVIKTRSYVDGLKKLKTDQLKSSSSSAATSGSGMEKALIALEFVNERAAHLAMTIKRSLTLLPNSPVSPANFFSFCFRDFFLFSSCGDKKNYFVVLNFSSL